MGNNENVSGRSWNQESRKAGKQETRDMISGPMVDQEIANTGRNPKNSCVPD